MNYFLQCTFIITSHTHRHKIHAQTECDDEGDLPAVKIEVPKLRAAFQSLKSFSFRLRLQMENYAQEPHLKTLVFAMIKFSQLLLLGLLAKIKCGFAGLQLGEKYYCSITWIVE